MLIQSIKGDRLQLGLPLQLINCGQHLLAAVDPLHRDTSGGSDITDGELLLIRVGVHLERPILQSKDPGHAAAKPVIDVRSHLHERRQRGLETLVPTDNRAEGWVVQSLVDLSARHHNLVRVTMTAVLGVPAANQAVSTEFASHIRTDIGELYAGDGRIDHTKLAPHAGTGLRLGVKRVVMTGSPLGPDQDAIAWGRQRLVVCGRFPHGQCRWKRHTEPGKCPNLKESPAGDPRAVLE